MIAKIIFGGIEMTQTIMVIDDEIEILDMLKRYFSLEGYHVITAAGGKEALQKLAKQYRRAFALQKHTGLCFLSNPLSDR